MSAHASADVLAFDEATTRTRLIDSLLASVGWNVAAGEASTAEVGKEVEVRHQPTESGIGYADYVLWDDNGNPLAVIEAKKTSVDPERGRQQAKLYADGFEKGMGIARSSSTPMATTSGSGMMSQGFPPRKLFGFYSKDSLQYLANFQRESASRSIRLRSTSRSSIASIRSRRSSGFPSAFQTSTGRRLSFRRPAPEKRVSRSRSPICLSAPGG